MLEELGASAPNVLFIFLTYYWLFLCISPLRIIYCPHSLQIHERNFTLKTIFNYMEMIVH
jgi:hypothetical protein